MVEKHDWDFTETDGDFSLIDDLDILDTTDFEIVDLDSNKPLDESKDSKKEDDFVSILDENADSQIGEVIEPSTIVEEEVEATSEDESKAVETSEALSKDEEPAEVLKEEMSLDEEPTSEAVNKEMAEVEVKSENESSTSEAAVIVPAAALEEEEKLESLEREKGEEKMVTKFKQEDLNSALRSFLDISPDFLAAAVVSSDGFVIASALPENVDENKLGAMSAAILSLGERAASELEKGSLETVFVEGENGYVLLSSVNSEMLLVVSTTKYAKLGLVFYELSALKKTIRSFFE